MKLTKEQKQLAKQLREKQLAFANLVVLQSENKLSNAECYKRAGYKSKTRGIADSAAVRLLRNEKISAYIDSFKLSSAEETGLTLEYLDKKLKNMLDTTIADVCDVVPITVELNGIPTVVYQPVMKNDLADIPEAALSSINSIKSSRDGIQYTLPDKKALTELAYKRLGGLTEKHEHTGKDGADLIPVTAEQVEKARSKLKGHFDK